MPFIIHNKDESIGYYTGLGWDADDKLAKRYASDDEAEAVITRYKMSATAEEVAAEKSEPHTRRRGG